MASPPEQPASVLSLIGTTLLTSHKVLSLLKATQFQQPLNPVALREAVYLGYQPWAARRPDHVFEQSWTLLQHHSGQGHSLVLAALSLMAEEFLEPHHGSLHVKQYKFSAWQQSLVSRMSGVPLQAVMYQQTQANTWLPLPGTPRSPYEAALNWAGQHLPVLTPYDPLVEEYLNREGLHETHLHLNGSTHAECCWLRALHRPKREIQDFTRKWKDRKGNDAASTRELARAINPDYSPAELYRQLIVAGRLRQWLVAAATDSIADDRLLPRSFDALSQPELQHPIPESAPKDTRLRLTDCSSTTDELVWMQRLAERLQVNPSSTLERMFHLYLVLQNQYYRLLVQNEEQFGFDQFQKLTFTELREPAEADYLSRFNAMHGKQANISRTGYLEGRFSPKKTLRKNYALLKAVLYGYWQYLEGHDPYSENSNTPRSMAQLLKQLDSSLQQLPPADRSRQRLALVAHFIKQPWKPSKKSGPYRFYTLRTQLEHNTNILLQTLRRWPGLRGWVRGIDAASNELHAPPEVFASCYRACQHAGITRRSYHAGEDFPHLLSGLRAIDDALELLDLRNGDRIGHGTAMGILPSLWLERMPAQLIVRKGDWMLDLLTAWRLLRDQPQFSHTASQVATQLARLASDIFQTNISCTQLEAAMELRHLNVGYLQATMASDEAPSSFSMLWQAEAQRVIEAGQHNPDSVVLLWQWLSDEQLWERSEAQETVDATYFSASTYLALQQVLMQKVADRKVIIETLPTSNVRISQYHNFSEHHSLRWMRVPGFVQEGDPEIMVSLGSDDPGIFAADLNAEFYHLYSALRNQGISDKPALGYLAAVNERGREYRFHDPSIG